MHTHPYARTCVSAHAKLPHAHTFIYMHKGIQFLIACPTLPYSAQWVRSAWVIPRPGRRCRCVSDQGPPASSTVVTATLAETGLVSLGVLLLLASRLLFVAISVYYYYQVGRRPKKI